MAEGNGMLNNFTGTNMEKPNIYIPEIGKLNFTIDVLRENHAVLLGEYDELKKKLIKLEEENERLRTELVTAKATITILEKSLDNFRRRSF